MFEDITNLIIEHIEIVDHDTFEDEFDVVDYLNEHGLNDPVLSVYFNNPDNGKKVVHTFTDRLTIYETLCIKYDSDGVKKWTYFGDDNYVE